MGRVGRWACDGASRVGLAEGLLFGGLNSRFRPGAVIRLVSDWMSRYQSTGDVPVVCLLAGPRPERSFSQSIPNGCKAINCCRPSRPRSVAFPTCGWGKEIVSFSLEAGVIYVDIMDVAEKVTPREEMYGSCCEIDQA